MGTILPMLKIWSCSYEVIKFLIWRINKFSTYVPMGGAYHIFMSAHAPQVPYDIIGPKIAFRQYTLSLKVEKVSIFAPGNFFVES